MSIPVKVNSEISIDKHPGADLDYQFDWADWLGDDTISNSIWVVPTGITKESDTHDDTTATIWLSGGTDGQRYGVVNYVTTVGGRTEDKKLTVVIKSAGGA